MNYEPTTRRNNSFWTPHKILDWAQHIAASVLFSTVWFGFVFSIMWDFMLLLLFFVCVRCSPRCFVALGRCVLVYDKPSCKNDRERLRLHWTQFDYKTTHTKHKTWFNSQRKREKESLPQSKNNNHSIYYFVFLYCCSCFYSFGALKLKSNTALLLAIKMDLFSKLFPFIRWNGY